MDVRAVVGGNVRRLRRERGLTQEQLAEASGYPQQMISELENGKGNPTLTSLADLARALGASLSELVAV